MINTPGPESADALFRADLDRSRRFTDRLFASLMILQVVAAIGTALIISPRTWIGTQDAVHAHVWASILVGITLASAPLTLVVLRPGAAVTRYTVAIAQMLFSSLLIHVTGGRIETHFHVFGSLAFLAFYRDYKVLALASVVTAADHLVRGQFWSLSVFGVADASGYRWLEHAGWVVFEVAFLSISIRQSREQSRLAAERTAALESSRATIQQLMESKSRELDAYVTALDRHTLLSTSDRLGRIIDVNDGFCRLAGYSREELLGKDASFLDAGHHGPEFFQHIRDSISSGTAWRGELCYRARDGEEFWVDSTVIPQLDADGQLERYISLRFDITQSKHAESGAERIRQQLQDQHAELQTIIDAIPAFIYYKDDRNTILNLNQTAADSIGLPVEQIRGRPTEEFFPAQHAAAYLQDDIEVIRAGTPKLAIIEKYDTGPDTQRIIRTDKIPLRDPSGTFRRLVAIATDITDLTTANEKLRKAEERLSLAVKASRIGLWDWDVASGETYFNDTFYTMLGYKPAELPMSLETWKDLCHPEDLDGAMADITRHLDGETDVYVNEHRLRTKDGNWLWIRDTGEIVERDQLGQPARMIGLHIDVQHSREMMELAQAASRAKSEFLANMSHEIRTPMTAILGYADLLDTDPDIAKDPKQVADAIQTIRGNAKHLLTIVNDILDMSKIEAGRMTVERIATSPIQIVEEVASLVRPRAKGKGITLSVRYDTPIPDRINSDPTRLRQILLNLVGNAIKFTRTGGVTIHAECDPTAQRIAFRIVDTGIGMTPQQCAAILRFDAFTQADGTTTRRFGGTGLGLRISDALAGMLGGGIHIQSVHQQGSTVAVTIDTGSIDDADMITPDHIHARAQRPHAEPADSTDKPRDANPLAHTRILLAEDGIDNQRLISFHLEKAGAHVTVADNGRIAVDIINGAQPEDLPHLVIMDMQMPELDGYGATRQIRAAGHTVPIIALTAHAMEGDRDKCINAGCDEYLTKPIDRARLIDACRTMIDERPKRNVA